MKAPRTVALELGVFAALAWYVAAHWASGLVADAPSGRVFASVVLAVAVGAGLACTERVRGAPGALLRAACVLAGFGAGFVAIGLERGLLAPGRWDDLADGLDRGFAALGSVQWPYDGSEAWASLTLLLAVPLVLTSAAALAFWPRQALRPFALVLLLALYGVAVTEHQVDREIPRGMGLLVLTAAWLWLPRMPERGWRAAGAAGLAVIAACVAALPAAARYEDSEPLVDYQSWNPFAEQAATRFNWSHSYGPIDWPRKGTTLMTVRSDERHYWRVETLDTFDGIRWTRSGSGRGIDPLLPSPYDTSAETQFQVTIRDLDTDLIPVAGTALEVTGADPLVVNTADGTVEAIGESLDEGDSYTVEAYVPDPVPGEMRAAAPFIPDELIPYTWPFEGPTTTAQVLESPYAPVLRLAQRLARGQPTDYDIVRAVQSHLRTEYAYSEVPPERRFPLAAFLFRDRIGYCQQFSGAMALMLRMLGIPARVAAGFAPGSYDADTGEYRVRDLDAHSWVEVWFTDVGWIPFDPTPSVAPADLQASVNAASASRGAPDAGEARDPGQPPPLESGGGGGEDTGSSDGPALQSWMVIVAVLLLGAGTLAALRLRALARRRARVASVERELAVLTRLLARTGTPAQPRLTLWQLEARLAETAGPAAARYVRLLRDRRFAPRGARPPGAAARRDLRRALTRDRGPWTRAAAYMAMAPLSFRRD